MDAIPSGSSCIELMTILSITLPTWLSAYLIKPPPLSTLTERMQWVIDLGWANIQHGGGPFGAAIFSPSGTLVAAGVNLVESGHCSLLHAELVAIALAQQALGRYDLSAGGQEIYQLVSSTEPCAMCLGAIPWAGIGHLVCGARDEDARAIGFDEGAKPDHWPSALAQRGIQVEQDVLRPQAIALLQGYLQQGGRRYNAGLRPLIDRPKS